MNRKGFVFTTIAILIVISLLFIFAVHERLLPRTIAQTGRVQTMDRYIANLEEDLPRAAYIAGYRSLIAMEEHISSTGEYLTDVDAAFTSVFANGTINGSSYAIMENSTFGEFSQAFAQLAASQGMHADLTVISLEAYHEDPWFVTLNISVRTELADRAGAARFNRTTFVQATVPIDSIKDPLYTVSTQGRAPHIVVRSNLTGPLIDEDNDTTQLQLLLNNTLYLASSEAPSFMQRFSGDLSPSPNGIESLVRVGELDAQGIAVESCKSIVDHLYFGAADTDPNYLVVNMDSDVFWLDQEHLEEYGAEGKTDGTKTCT